MRLGQAKDRALFLGKLHILEVNVFLHNLQSIVKPLKRFGKGRRHLSNFMEILCY